MAFQLITVEPAVKITPELAVSWRDIQPVPSDRPLSDSRIERHRNTHAAGRLRPVSWATVECLENGETYRANGKHTSSMFADMTQADIDRPKGGQMAVIERYLAETLLDVTELYNTFDAKSQARTQSDVNRAFAANVEGMKDFDVRFLCLCVSAICFSDNPGAPSKREPEAKGRSIIDPENRAVFVWLDTMLNGTGTNSLHMRRMPVMAAMVTTYRKAPGFANLFWELVRTKEGSDPKIPSRQLADFLTMNALSGSKSSRHKTTAREFYSKCITAWNAYRESSPTSLAYFVNRPIPKPV